MTYFRIAAAVKDPAFTLQAHHVTWSPYCSTNALTEVRAHVANGLALYRLELHGTHALQYGAHDPGVCGYVTDSITTAVLGFLDQSPAQLEKGLALAQRSGLPKALFMRSHLVRRCITFDAIRRK
jgi:hypothetical protein